MKRTLSFLLPTLLGGAGAFALRLLYFRTGFEADTGFPIPGVWSHTALLALLFALTLLLLLLTRTLPRENGKNLSFSGAFSTESPSLLLLPAAGIGLLAASGLAELYEGVQSASRADLVFGVGSLLTAISLFSVLPACRRHSGQASRAFRAEVLLVPVCLLVLRLVAAYRTDSASPFLSTYVAELLALILLILGFYRLSSFAYDAANTRRFALYALLSVVFCAAALSGAHPLSLRLFYLGGAATLTGFFLLRMASVTPGARQA